MVDEPLPGGIDPQRAVEMANDAIRGTLMERMGIEWTELRLPPTGGEPVAVATLTVSIRDP